MTTDTKTTTDETLKMVDRDLGYLIGYLETADFAEDLLKAQKLAEVMRDYVAEARERQA